jgi:hypothetical protein
MMYNVMIFFIRKLKIGFRYPGQISVIAKVIFLGESLPLPTGFVRSL